MPNVVKSVVLHHARVSFRLLEVLRTVDQNALYTLIVRVTVLVSTLSARTLAQDLVVFLLYATSSTIYLYARVWKVT